MTILPTDEPQQSDNLTEKLDGISSPQNSDNNTEILNVNQPEDEHQSHVIISEDEISNSVLPKNNTKISWILKVTPAVANKSKLQVLHIPKEHAKGHFRDITDITLKSKNSDFHMPATIITTKRSIQNNKRDEKQIEQPWFQYLRKHKLMIGDEIQFEVQEKDDCLFVTHKAKKGTKKKRTV
ncbi:hypothetical protein QL285_039678 [Trifolium repens]|nr:hypothetical protein QL285_039678 [Trifolium repens]